LNGKTWSTAMSDLPYVSHFEIPAGAVEKTRADGRPYYVLPDKTLLFPEVEQALAARRLEWNAMSPAERGVFARCLVRMGRHMQWASLREVCETYGLTPQGWYAAVALRLFEQCDYFGGYAAGRRTGTLH
jgi:hypothetical protein